GDNLFLLRKVEDQFESLDSMPCGFVRIRGKYRMDDLEPISLDTLPEWPQLQEEEIARRRFWWGGLGRSGFLLYSLGIRAFLGISEPTFRVFKRRDSQLVADSFFGLWDSCRRSLVLAKDDWLIAYGSRTAQDHLLDKMREWVELGMPSAASFTLQIHQSGVES